MREYVQWNIFLVLYYCSINHQSFKISWIRSLLLGEYCMCLVIWVKKIDCLLVAINKSPIMKHIESLFAASTIVHSNIFERLYCKFCRSSLNFKRSSVYRDKIAVFFKFYMHQIVRILSVHRRQHSATLMKHQEMCRSNTVLDSMSSSKNTFLRMLMVIQLFHIAAVQSIRPSRCSFNLESEKY